MEDQNKTVMLKITIDDAAYKKKIVDLQKDINKTKKEEQELAKAIKLAGSATDEQIAQQVELKNRLKDLSTEQRGYQAGLDAKAKAEAAAAGSMKQMSLTLSEMKKQYRELSEEERKSEFGVKMQKDMKNLNDELLSLEKSYGQHGRNVGNYAGSMIEAADSTGILTKAMQFSSTAIEKGKGAIDGFKEGMGGANKASFLLGGGLKALMAIPILLLFTGLLALLTKTQAGMDFLERATGSVTAAFDVFVKAFAKVGEGLVKLFQDPKRIFTDFNGVMDDLKVNLGEVGKEAARAGAEMYNLIKLEQELKRERILNSSTSKRLLRDIEALKNIRDDETKSLKERQKANADAFKLEQQRNAELSDMAKREMDILIEKAAATARLSKAETEAIKRHALNNSITEAQVKLLEVTDSELENIIASQNELFDIQEDSNGKQNEFITNRVSLMREASEKEKAIIEARAAAAQELSEKETAALQKRLADERAALELAVLQTPEGSEERLEAQIELAKKEMEISLSAKELTENQKKLIQAKYDQSEIEARKEHAANIIAIAKAQAEEFARIKQEEYQQAQKYTDEYYAQEKLKASQGLADGSITQAQYQARLEELQRQSLENQLQNSKEYGGSTLAIEQQLADLKISNRQKEADTKEAIAHAEVEAAGMIAQSMGDIASLVAGQSEEAANFQKALTLFQIGLASAEAITKGIASSQSLPFPGNLVAMATTVATVTANLLRAKELLSNSTAPTAPKFAAGGFTGSGSGAPDSTGYKVAGVVHENEWVAPEWMTESPVYSKYIEHLEAVRQRGYATGGYVAPLGLAKAPAYTIPQATINYLSGGAAPVIDYDKLAKALQKQPVVASWSDGQKVGRRIEFRESLVNQ